MRRLAVALAAVLGLTLAAGVAFAVQLGLNQLAEVGGTGQVPVNSPEADGTIDQLEWIMAQTAPFHVDAVNITWAPNSNGNYTIYITVYGDSLAGPVLVGYGFLEVTNLVAGTTYEHTVDLTGVDPVTGTTSQTIDPAVIYYVEVVIVQDLS